MWTRNPGIPMTLPNSADSIYCQTCATAWPITSTDGQHYFRGALSGVTQTGHDIGDYTSPAAIAALDPAAVMTFCPACDTEALEPTPILNAPVGVRGRDPFYTGDDPMVGAHTDPGEVPDASPGDADSAVTHRTEDTI